MNAYSELKSKPETCYLPCQNMNSKHVEYGSLLSCAAMLVSFYWIQVSPKHEYDEKSDLIYEFVVLCYVLSIKWLALFFLSNLNVLITVKCMVAVIVSIKSECDHSEINGCLCSELKFILALFSTARNDGFQAENGRSKWVK